MAGKCRIFVLGEFRAEVDGEAVPPEAWRHRRGADLVKILALAPGHRLHREQIIEALWPDLDPEAGSANLRKAVHYARQALGTEAAVKAEGQMVGLWSAGRLSVDAEDFERDALDAIGSGDPEAAERAARCYTGDVLPEDQYESWAAGPRERLRRRHLETLRVAERWDRLVELDPVDEEAHRALMRAHLEAGNRQAAMRQFELLRETLHEELGVGPDPETVALYQDVLALEGEEPATPAERSASHLAAALVALNRMDLEEAEREATLARTLAIESGLGREVGEASGVLGMVAHAKGRWRELFREEFLQTVTENPHLAGFVFDAHLCFAEFWLVGAESHSQVEAFARDLLQTADRHRSLHGQALATLIIGETELLSGRVREAETDLSLAAELHGRAGATSGQALSLERLAEAALAGGRRARARRLLKNAQGLALAAPLRSHLLVRVHGARIHSAAEPSAALVEAQAAEADLAGREVCEPCSMDYLVAASIAHARAGDLAGARTHLEQADRIAGMWQGGPWRAAVWEARGELRLAEGEPGQAAALFREAAGLFARVGHPLSVARCMSAAKAADEAPARNAAGTTSS